ERGSDIVRQGDDVVAQQDEKVVAETVVLAQLHRDDESPRRLSTSSNGLAASPALPASIHVIRGSRRNQRSWRTANWRVRVIASSTASGRPTSPRMWARSSR